MVKNPYANAADTRGVVSIRRGRSPGGGNGNPLQYSCLGNPVDRGAWWATGHWVAKRHDYEPTHARLISTDLSLARTESHGHS